MNLWLSPSEYKRVGVMLTLLGVLLIVLGIVFGTMTALRRSGAAAAIKVSEAECLKRIQSLGLATTQSGNTITAKAAGLENGTLMLSRASLAINFCPGWLLESFCMGEGCEPAGVHFTLKRAP